MTSLDGNGEDLVRQELDRLSFEDRNAINEEVHGVSCLAPEETPELLEQSLSALELSLNRMVADPPSLKSAYNLVRNSVSYVNERNFRLRFLRCELFDVEKTALRIIKYLDVVLAVSGEDALRTRFLLDHFNKEEMKLLRSGCIQLLPYRDRAGRPVLAFVGEMSFSSDKALKILLYILSVLRDTESQRKGLVVTIYPNNASALSKFSFHQSHTNEFFKRFLESTSIRICAIHACFPDTFSFQKFGPSIVRALYPSLRSRLKYSDESNIPRRHIFSGYGIPMEMIPITDTGNVKLTFLRQWIKLRTISERKDSFGTSGTFDDPGKIVEFPGSSDVLYRTGTTTPCHPGNAAFRELIESKIENGKIFSEISLKLLADALITEVLEIRFGRFLKWDSRGFWVVLSDRSQIRVKVVSSIRDFYRWKGVVQNLDCSKDTSGVEKDVKRRRMSSDGNERKDTDASTLGSSKYPDVNHSG